MTEHTTKKLRVMCAIAALTLTVLPVSCGTNNRDTTSNGVNQNGIYDGSNDGGIMDRAGRVIDGTGDAIERGADRVASGLDNIDDNMTNTTTSTTYTTSTTTTTTTRSAASKR